MYNYYDYEASFPTDKASYKVLYNDYFHDSLITAVEFKPEKHTVQLHIQCSRECEWETGDWRRDILDEKYGYVLTFGGVSYFDMKTQMDCPEYLNGRFKAIPKGKYYFRIQTADGYIDIGYSRFRLRKTVGRVSYRGITEADLRMGSAKPASQEEISRILERLRSDDYTEEQDFDLYMDLEYLYACKVPGLGPFLRRYVKSQWPLEDAVPFAAWLLGRYGNADDIPLILQLIPRTDHPGIRQNLMDAVEAMAEPHFIQEGERFR